jgi:hypothetical protein
MQIVAYVVALAALASSARRAPWSDRLVSFLLAFFWGWMGWMYHLRHFAAINPAANVFGAAFLLQGLLFLASGVLRPPLSFAPRANAYGIAGAAMMVYAMLIYPLIGTALGHGYPRSPSFGVAPCPTTIFTFGILLWARRVPSFLLVIPLLWSVVGFFAAVHLGILEDTLLLVSGVIATAMILVRNRKAETIPVPPAADEPQAPKR